MKTNQSKAWYKRWWVWLIIVVLLIGVGGALGGDKGTPNNNPQSDTDTSKSEQKQPEPVKPKWDVETAYAALVDGMTKAEAEAAMGKTSDNCTESSSEYIGKTEYCSYGGVGDNGMISVSYQNDKLSSKTKSKF